MCDENQTRQDFAWRVCWDWQMKHFEAKNIAIGKPTTEMTGNPHLGGQPCLIFTRDPGVLGMFLESRPGGGILRINLAKLNEDQWVEWSKTGDVHVHAQVVLDHAEIVDLPQ
jgi:hypothetical protein